MAQGSRKDPDSLLVLLDTAYNQASWHGPNLRGSLRGVTLDAASWRPQPGGDNAWELMVHAAYWKDVVWRPLTGAAAHDVYHAGQIQLFEKLGSRRHAGR